MIVTEDLDLPAGHNPYVAIHLELVTAAGDTITEAYAAGKTIIGDVTPDITQTGKWQADLVPNSTITPAGSRWRRKILDDRGGTESSVLLTVPATGGPYRVDQILA